MRQNLDSCDITMAVLTGTVQPIRVRFADVPAVVKVVVPFSPGDPAR